MTETNITWRSTVNGDDVELCIPPAKRLLDMIREDLQLTGTKISCEIGRCGACMVLLEGKPANSCLVMAYQSAGKHITTIEGLACNGGLQSVQQAFLEEGGFQCGYCTPGMLISVKALLDEIPNPNPEEIKEALLGNLCRCTGYGGIFRAVERAVN
jgi:aerobic carbon-monoxide dehydrogenase small subunit